MPESESGRHPQESAHDVLAAEAFAVPARDPSLTHGPVKLPDDPTGIAEPHDILAAEEFAMPAVGGGSTGGSLARHAGRNWPLLLALALAVLMAARRRPRSRARR